MDKRPERGPKFLDAFAYPFRPGWMTSWVVGLVLLVALPVGIIPLLGYLVRAVRCSAAQPGQGPPGWRPDLRLFSDGLSLALALAPPLLLWLGLWRWLGPPSLDLAHLLVVVQQVWVENLVVLYVMGLLLWAPVGLALVVVGPPAVATFAATGRLQDLFDLVTAARTVRQRWEDWNLAAITILTAVALALAASGLLCLGLIPGTYYALLVSAHATARFAR